MRRTVLAATAAIALAFLASVIVIDRQTRAAPGVSRAVPMSATAATPPAADAAPPASARPAPPVAGVPPPRPATGRPAATRTRSAVAASASTPVSARVPRSRAVKPLVTPARIDLSFKVDPRLTRSLHMGDRWVSPPTYSASGDLKSVSVGARARVIGGGALPSHPPPEWRTSEPDMVQVSPERGDQVEITIWRAGESSVTVESGGASRTMIVKAAQLDVGLRVDISQ